jgi:hypothetical protein
MLEAVEALLTDPPGSPCSRLTNSRLSVSCVRHVKCLNSRWRAFTLYYNTL